MKKIIKYIDCDGVIFDTEFGLFDEYNRLKSLGVNIRKETYLRQLNWETWIRQARVINDAITILNEHDSNGIIILTKIHSLLEGLAKIKYFRELKVKNNIILVPNTLDKSSVVHAEGNLLVDDSIKNLDDWDEHNGIPFFFNASGENKAKFKEQVTINTDYPLVSSLEDIFSAKTDEYCQRRLLKK